MNTAIALQQLVLTKTNEEKSNSRIHCRYQYQTKLRRLC